MRIRASILMVVAVSFVVRQHILPKIVDCESKVRHILHSMWTLSHHGAMSEVTSKTLFVGTGREAGADEDDFHTFKRMTAEVDKSEKAEEKAKKKAGVKVGALSGVVRAFGDTSAPKKKKVVVF